MDELLGFVIEFLRNKMCGKTEFRQLGVLGFCGHAPAINFECCKCSGNFVWAQLPFCPKEPIHCPHCGRKNKYRDKQRRTE